MKKNEEKKRASGSGVGDVGAAATIVSANMRRISVVIANTSQQEELRDSNDQTMVSCV